ncbi:IS3 family transposase [Micromonospora sp. CPCC 206060]|uniref:IS3 family transposase n=1 Tax=Micromonospora sp. CPCC 206060 TaxID=3122406 RepID=UPI002FF22EE2
MMCRTRWPAGRWGCPSHGSTSGVTGRQPAAMTGVPGWRPRSRRCSPTRAAPTAALASASRHRHRATRAGLAGLGHTIPQLMATSGLTARARRRRRSLTRQGTRPAAPDLVKRVFTAPAPDRVWCGDMTEIRTDEGKLYLATVIDLYSRRILGYAMGAHHDAGLVVAALNMAAVSRGGSVEGVIFHSDRGAEYSSADFPRACTRWKVRQSMGRVGSCFDNAVAEATFSTIKVEYVHRSHFRTRTEARLKIATWITDFYNRRRRHSVCDWRSPIDYERSEACAMEARAA